MSLQTLAVEIAEWLLGTGKVWPLNPPQLAELGRDSLKDKVDLAPIVNVDTFKKLLVGLLEVTDTSQPLYFGNKPHDDETNTIGSTSKLAILYAACQLREDVRTVLQRNPIAHLTQLQNGLKTFWNDADKPAALRALAMHRSRWPRLEKIFDLAALPVPDPAAFHFQGWETCGVAGLDEVVTNVKATRMRALDDYHQLEHDGTKLERWIGKGTIPGLVTFPFGERLWLTSAWSDDAAATSCWKDIGSSYQQILMTESGMFQVAGGKSEGFHCGATFIGQWNVTKNAGRGFDHEIDALPISDAQKALLRPYEEESYGPTPYHSGSIRTLLGFLLALVRRQLISHAASEDIISLIRKLDYVRDAAGPITNHGTTLGMGSYFDLRLPDLGLIPPLFKPLAHGGVPPAADYYDFWSKIGISFGPAFFSDVALIDFEGGPDAAHTKRRAVGLAILKETHDPFANDPASQMTNCALEILKKFVTV